MLGAVAPLLAAAVALPLALALALPLLLAPGAARAAGRASPRPRGALRAAVVDPLIGIEDTLAAGAEPTRRARLAREARLLGAAQRALAGRAAWAARRGRC